MRIERQYRNRMFRGGNATGTGMAFGPDPRAARRGFTLIEVLLALLVLAIILVAIHAVFFSAIQLRNKTDAAFQEAIPLQHALMVIKRDVANVTVPGGIMTGTFQTTLTTGSSMSSSHYGVQCGPTFYTASGTLNDTSPWSEMRKVSYYLMPPTNNSPGMDLVRSVTRNLLPVATEEYTDEKLLSGVHDLTFEYYNGTQWVDTWDSTSTTISSTSSNTLPSGVRVQLTLAVDDIGSAAQTPIELVIPIEVQSPTNSTSVGGGQ